MRITLKTAISIAIFIALYTGFQGGRYFLANRVQEIGILCAMALFVYGAVMTAFTIKSTDLRWSWWVFATLFFLAYTFVLPAQRFSANAGVSIVPSLFASREFLIALLCPALYFLYRLGFEVERIEKIFLVTLVALMISYIFHYFRMDLRAAYFSTNHAIAGLVTFDPWRGYRLKTPSFAFYLLSVLAPMFIFMSQGMTNKVKWILMTVLLGYVWILVSQRSMAASLIAATLAYHFLFAKKVRIGLLFLVLPALIIAVTVGVSSAVEHLSKLDPETDGVRYKSGMIAWESFLNTPLFGFGQQSNSTLTEQNIFWYKFFSADLGLIGILFKYGAVGAVVYIAFSIFLIKRMIVTNWMIKKTYGKINPVIFSLLIVYLAFTLNILLTPAFTYIPGI
ncbi:MAG: O-antigen ligase family protein, partial [Hydrogenophaga sp.]|uniref:O-antigen ligase family protein n=1 Tax=Hydrogenophaga sp. TaxID=1904254 RepID=UPI002AB9A50E